MKLLFKIKKTPNFVFDYLTDMNKFVTVHPVITKIEKADSGSYLVHETLKLGFIPISFTYPVTVESNPINNTVVICATVMKFTKIEMFFLLKAGTDFTIIEEEIRFKTILPIKSLMENIFKKQHGQLFKNIEAL